MQRIHFISQLPYTTENDGFFHRYLVDLYKFGCLASQVLLFQAWLRVMKDGRRAETEPNWYMERFPRYVHSITDRNINQFRFQEGLWTALRLLADAQDGFLLPLLRKSDRLIRSSQTPPDIRQHLATLVLNSTAFNRSDDYFKITENIANDYIEERLPTVWNEKDDAEQCIFYVQSRTRAIKDIRKGQVVFPESLLNRLIGSDESTTDPYGFASVGYTREHLDILKVVLSWSRSSPLGNECLSSAGGKECYNFRFVGPHDRSFLRSVLTTEWKTNDAGKLELTHACVRVDVGRSFRSCAFNIQVSDSTVWNIRSWIAKLLRLNNS